MQPQSADTWRHLFQLLDAALDVPDAARADWLARLEAEGEPRLLELRELLASRARIASLDFIGSAARLHPGPSGPDAEQPPDEVQPGARIGAYRLLRPIGSGGMGAVWLAERADGLFRRPVALKLPHVGPRARVFAERAAREREILAALEHPNIARLYDAGITESGQPYLALEAVDGEPIAAYCDHRGLGVAARVRLFLGVLRAVQHAHSRLVVHRDLKPSNILVDASGNPKLLDFGIAKLMLEQGEAVETELTRAGGRAVTPAYASPEQIGGQVVGAASDLYSAGILLCELLSGARPYRLRRDSAAALEEAIDAADLHRPSQLVDADAARRRGTTVRALARALSGDLDTIVLKALKRRPEERYDSAAAFADDLERHLRHEPVRARPDQWHYRTSRFLRRHALASTAAAVVVTALGVSAAISWSQRQQAVVAARAARSAQAEAVAAQNFLADLFRANSLAQEDPAAARRLTAPQLLDRGARSLETSDSVAPPVRAALWRLIAEMYEHLDLDRRAIDAHERAVAATRLAHGERSRELGEALVAQGAALWGVLEFDRSRTALRDGLALLEDVAPRSEAVIRGLAVQSRALVDENSVQALAVAERADRLAREIGARDAVRAVGRQAVGLAHAELGHFAEAEAALREALKLQAAAGARETQRLQSLIGLADALYGSLRLREAADVYAQAIAVQLRTHDSTEALSQFLRYRRAAILLALGDRAELQRERAALVEHDRARPVQGITQIIRIRLAFLELLEGDTPHALPELEPLVEAIPANGWYLAADAHARLALARLWMGHLAEARRELDRARAAAAGGGMPASLALDLATVEALLLGAAGDAPAGLRLLADVGARVTLPAAFTSRRLEFDLARGELLAQAGDWDGVDQLVRGWRTTAAAQPIQLPLAAAADLARLAATSAQARGAPSRALFLIAQDLWRRADVAQSPRLARVEHQLAAAR